MNRATHAMNSYARRFALARSISKTGRFALAKGNKGRYTRDIGRWIGKNFSAMLLGRASIARS